MSLKIHQDGHLQPSQAETRRVAFAPRERAPLTPHRKTNTNQTPCITSTLQKSPSTAYDTTMNDDKENQQQSGGATSLRRQLRATMSPVPTSNNKENECRSKPFKRSAAATTTATRKTQVAATTAYVLTPSVRHNQRRSLKVLKTPKSLLRREIAFTDAEESFLISPTGDALIPIDDAVETGRPLMSPFEESTTDTSHMKLSEKSCIPIDGSQNVAPVETQGTTTDDNEENEVQEMNKETRASGRAAKRALLRQQRSQQRSTSGEKKPVTGNTPYRKRGNGVQMDLSTMFTEIASPDEKQQSLSVSTSAPVHPTQHEDASIKKSRNAVGAVKKMPSSILKSKTSEFLIKSSPRNDDSRKLQTSEVARVFDEKWADKQCEAFAGWLNYTFQPTEDKDHEISVFGNDNERRKTADRAALRTLILHRRISNARARAIEVFNSDSMQAAQRAIHDEVARRRLKLRVDRDMYADLTLRNQITSLLLSYSTPWLRLGLETIFGEMISPGSPNQFSPPKTNQIAMGLSRKTEKVTLSQMKLTLKAFIVNRVLSDPATLNKYTKGLCNVPSGNFEKRFKAEMRALTLRRLLTLIIFLDRAREANIMDRVPRLFETSAKVKSTREVITSLCRDFLSSEGNIIKHLSRIGLVVSYIQAPVDEIDYTIDNLATDLRDGVRLARMTEISTCREPKSIMCMLRLPAVSRLQKLHNVGYVLRVLQKDGVARAGDIVPHHIVDGHREMVLKLMWAVLAHYGLKALLNEDSIEEEIHNVTRANSSRRPRWKLQLGAAMPYNIAANDQAAHGQEGLFKSLLLRWCNAVCSCFGRSVSDFTASFADGTVFCLLIHYYHPGMLPLDRILPTTRNLSAEERDNADKYGEALLREARNFELAQSTMSELGGIPKMIKTANSDNTPEEKATLLSVAYLCSRLMESSREVLACIQIQNCYCRYMRRVDLEKKLVAAAFIFKFWQANKDQYYANQRMMFFGPLLVIERFFLSKKDQLLAMRRKRLREETEICAAILIQSVVRRAYFAGRLRPIFARHRSAVKIQMLWRRYDAMIQLQLRILERQATVSIQTYWRGFKERAAYAQQVDSVVLIQAISRGYVTRRVISQRQEATITIQRIWRGFWAQLQAQLDIMDVITVQSMTRRWLASLQRDTQRKAILVLQRNVRRGIAVRAFAKLQLEREEFDRQHSVAVLCQSYVRRYLAMRAFDRKCRDNTAAIILQASWLGSKTRKLFQAMKGSAIAIQSMFRCARSRRSLQIQSQNALLIQRTWRCFDARIRLSADIRDIILVQSLARRWRVERLVAAENAFTVIIQAKWRVHVAYKSFQRKRDLVIALQSKYRGFLVRREIFFLGVCATAIQAAWRCYSTKLEYQLDLVDIILTQSTFRRRAAILEAQRWQLALSILQSFARMCIATWEVQRLRAENAEHKRKVASSVCLESAVRKFLAVRALKSQLKVITQCQARARRYLLVQQLRRTTSSAVSIQTIWRGFAVLTQYKVIRAYTILLQSYFRGKRAQALRVKRLDSILCLQRAARFWNAVRHADFLRRHLEEKRRIELFLRHSSAKIVQAVFRGHAVRKEFRFLTVNAVKIQSCCRAFLARIDYELQLIDVILLQSVARGWLTRSTQKSQQKSILVIQNFARVCIANEEARRLRHIRDEEERELRVVNQAAALIQKTWRCYTVHVDYMLLILSAITIQSVVRRHQTVAKCKVARGGILALQALSRGVVERSMYRRRQESAVIIQASTRAYLAQCGLRRFASAAVSVQRVARGFLTRVNMDLNRFAACEIQRVWRGFQQNVEFVVQVIAAITVQSAIRRALASREARHVRESLFLESIEIRFLNKKAISIQRAFRAYAQFKISMSAASSLQAIVRGFQSRLQLKKMHVGIAVLQGTVRGHLVRRRRPEKARVIAKRLAIANMHACHNPSMRLGVRTASALDVLQNSTRLAEIMKAVAILETSTRLSRNCCIAFADCNAPEISYSLVRTCNRSLPHVELLHYVLLTLSNVASHRELLWRVFTDESVDVFIDMVQMFRDKDNVFTLAVALLHKAVASNCDLKNRCATSENIKRMKGVHSLCVRKLSANSTRATRTSRRSVGPLDRKQGVHVLQKVISILDG